MSKLKAIGYTEADLRTLIRRQLLRQKVFDAITKDVPTTAEQVWARHILVATQDEANKVEDLLKQGKNFADLAKQYSTDTSNKDNGGDLGWFTRGQMVKEFEDEAFKLKVGEISPPIQTSFGFHIIQVLGHETRPLTEQQLTTARQKAYDDWLTGAKQTAKVQIYDTVWTAAVPTEPAVPASLEAQLQQLNGAQNQALPNQPLPIPTQATPAGPSPAK